MPSKRPCFPSGREMPENLYHNKLKAKRGQSYRYRHPDGRMEIVKTADESIAEQVAIALNEQRGSAVIVKDSTGGTTASYNDRQFGYWVEDYIENVLAKKKISAGRIRSYSYYLRRHFSALYPKLCAEIRRPHLLEAWEAITFHAQKNSRPAFRSCINHMINKELLTSLINGNPFVRACDGGFDYKEMEDKIRKTMSVELFTSLIKKANEIEMPFLVDALELGYLTGLRITDILNLRFDDIKDGNLTKIISKTSSRKKSRKAANSYSIEEHKDIQVIISRAKLRLLAGSDCPFIVHHEYKRVVKDAHTKLHDNQVTRYYANECLHKCMDKIAETKNMPRAERPTFHEIRALIFAVLDGANTALKDVSTLLGHADTKITQSAYGTHKKIDINQITTPRSLKELKDYAAKNL